ncbi:MAG: hypothetical protein IPK50_18620 [Fibrobacterota bacterium]|nr:MAG: hypothetical protein IPK50_18620 [Fibrobacterota bacterium]
MKRIALALILAASATFAVPNYQVTGKLLYISKDTVKIQKGNEIWMFQPGPNMAQAVPGSKVVLHYSMTANSLQVVPDAVSPAAVAPGVVKRATSTKAH